VANAYGWRRFGIEIGTGIEIECYPDPDFDVEPDMRGQARVPINESV